MKVDFVTKQNSFLKDTSVLNDGSIILFHFNMYSNAESSVPTVSTMCLSSFLGRSSIAVPTHIVSQTQGIHPINLKARYAFKLQMTSSIDLCSYKLSRRVWNLAAWRLKYAQLCFKDFASSDSNVSSSLPVMSVPFFLSSYFLYTAIINFHDRISSHAICKHFKQVLSGLVQESTGLTKLSAQQMMHGWLLRNGVSVEEVFVIYFCVFTL